MTEIFNRAAQVQLKFDYDERKLILIGNKPRCLEHGNVLLW